MSRHVLIASLVNVALLLAMPCLADNADQAVEKEAQAADQIEGKWVIYQKERDGQYMTVKEHRDGITILTTYDPKKKVLYSHRSEYTVDDKGSAQIFRYGNKLVLAGPDAGATDKRENAYIFRVDGDRFYEVHGMLPGDKGKPSLTVWERLKEPVGEAKR